MHPGIVGIVMSEFEVLDSRPGLGLKFGSQLGIKDNEGPYRSHLVTLGKPLLSLGLCFHIRSKRTLE